MSNRIRRSAYCAAITLTSCLALSGCWWNSDNAENLPPAAGPAAVAVTLTGQVYARAVDGAGMAVYAADATGRRVGPALATGVTDHQGNFSLTMNSLPSGGVLVVATGGTYLSEADGLPQTLGTLATLLPAVVAGTNTVQINPLTNTIAAAASALLTANGGALASAVNTATATIARLFGLAALAGNPAIVQADPAATAGDAWILAALAGTLEQLRLSSTVLAAALYQALADDASDGKLDGRINGQAITLSGGSTTLASSLFTTEWSGAANAYANAHPVYAAAVAPISAALQNSAQAVGIAIGSSGSIAPLQTQSGGTQIYFAARADGLVRLDMNSPTNPVAAKVTAINNAVMLNTSVSPPTGYFTSLDGIVIDPTPIDTGNGAKVFAILYSYSSKTVVSVNLTDGVVAQTATLNINNTASFSGATASIAGGISDGAHTLIWLATGDGLLGLNPSDLTQAPILIAQPPNTSINENIGGDPAKSIVYSPDYENNGLVIFNLAEHKAYAMDAATWATTVGAFQSVGEVDGVSLDSTYNVAVMTPEFANSIAVLAYTTPSGATTSVGALPAGTKFKIFPSIGRFAGSAFDPVSHTGLFVGEGSGLGVGVLDDPANANWAGLSTLVVANTSSYRFERHDPHTVGALNVGNNPYGFVLQGTAAPYQVVVIDMKGWLNATASGGSLVTDPLLNPQVAKLVSY